jgi:GxxExxY protein
MDRRGFRGSDHNHDGRTAGREDGVCEPDKTMIYRVRTPLSDDEELVAGEVIAAALKVHRDLGPGFLESIYRRAMAVEFRRRAVSFETEVPVEVRYEGELLGTHRVDLIVQGLVVVELKSVESLDPVHRKQVVSYLKSTKLRLGLLINFNCELLKHGLRRVVV